MGSVFGAHATVALASGERGALLECQGGRDRIGTAKVIIMARQQVSDDEASDIPRLASQRMSVKLRDLAAQLVYSTTTETPARAAECRNWS